MRTDSRPARAIAALGAACVVLAAAGAAVGASSSSQHHLRHHHHHHHRRHARHRLHFPGPGLVQALGTGQHVALGVAPDYPLRASIGRFEDLVHRHPVIVGLYQQWSEPVVYRGQLREVAAHGAVPMIAWDASRNGVPIPLRKIVAGAQDRYLRRSALLLRRWGHPVLLRFDPEMNLADSVGGTGHDGNTPAEFVAAWRHIVRLFRRLKVGNVDWAWTPNVDCAGHCPFRAYYPGNGWVGWVGLDGYNYGTDPGSVWMSFRQVFQNSYRELAALSNKPVMIAETACSPVGGDEAGWIRAIRPVLRQDLPRVRLLDWFERIKETNWMVSSSLPTLRAFRGLVASPLFRGIRWYADRTPRRGAGHSSA